MASQYALTVTNEKIWKFFQLHPALTLEATALLFIDLHDKLTLAPSATLNTSITAELMDQIKRLQLQVTSMAESFTSAQANTTQHFNSKLEECKKNYIEDVKTIMSSNVMDRVAPLLREQNSMMLDKTQLLFASLVPKNQDDTGFKQIQESMKTLQSSMTEFKMEISHNVVDKVAPLVKEQNAIMLDRTRLLMNELLPKHNEDQLAKQLQDSMRILQCSITEETNKLLTNSITPKSFADFIQGVEHKFASVAQSSQTLFGSTEQRLDLSIRDIKASTEAQLSYLKDNHTVTTALNTSVLDLLKKMENSSSKGKLSENIVSSILHALYPSAQIDSVGTTKETGDIILSRLAKPKILIENKNWERNVTQDEVKKFIHDVERNNCCGLFLSQNYGVAHKENFQIDISGKNVVLYLHEVQNDAEKIKVAINIIDHFKAKLDELDSAVEYDTISKDVLDDIKREYHNYGLHKLTMIKLIKDCNQTLLKQIDELQLPSLDDYLMKRFASSTSKFVCECGFIGKNQSSMSAHQRACTRKTIVTQVLSK